MARSRELLEIEFTITSGNNVESAVPATPIVDGVTALSQISGIVRGEYKFKVNENVFFATRANA